MFLVTGATGNVGGSLVGIFAAGGHPVRALTRGGGAGLPDGVEAVTGDLNEPSSLGSALDGVDGVFLLPGYRDMPGLLAACRDAGVRRVVLLSSSSVPGGEPSNAVTAYMMRSEEAVRSSGLPWTFLRPAGFMSNTLQWASQLHAGDLVRAPWPEVRVAMIDPHDVAAVAAAALTGEGHAGKAYRLSGPDALRPADRVRVLAEVLGRDLRFEGQSDEEARAEMSAAMPAEYVDAFFRFYSDGTLDESPVLPTVSDITGAAPRTFRDWATAHASAFTSPDRDFS